MDRREFTLEAALAVLGGAVITISGCAQGGNPASGTLPPSSTGNSTGIVDKTAGISSNHGHKGVITSAQLVAGNAIAVDIHGEADHTHGVTLTSEEISSIRAGTRVQKDSTSGSTGGVSHNHAVTFNPTDPNDPTRY